MNYTWENFIKEEQEKDYFKKVKNFVENRRKIVDVYPEDKNVFEAFKNTDFESIKVVLIGQDPYHQKGQAHGLSFSVLPDKKIPKSLSNIYNEVKASYPHITYENGFLEKWSSQGVFLINSILTVEDSKPNSHKKIGWEIFTSKAIKKINDELSNVVFLSWGKNAHKLCVDIDQSKHKLIKTSHPSPLGCYKSSKDFEPFKGSKCFEKTNNYLVSKGIRAIEW